MADSRAGPRGGGKYNQSSIDHCFSGELLEVLATKRRKNFLKSWSLLLFPRRKRAPSIKQLKVALSLELNLPFATGVALNYGWEEE